MEFSRYQKYVFQNESKIYGKTGLSVAVIQEETCPGETCKKMRKGLIFTYSAIVLFHKLQMQLERGDIRPE